MRMDKNNSRFVTILEVRFADSPNEWTQVDEVKLGSLKKPNKNIIEIRFRIIPKAIFDSGLGNIFK